MVVSHLSSFLQRVQDKIDQTKQVEIAISSTIREKYLNQERNFDRIIANISQQELQQ